MGCADDEVGRWEETFTRSQLTESRGRDQLRSPGPEAVGIAKSLKAPVRQIDVGVCLTARKRIDGQEATQACRGKRLKVSYGAASFAEPQQIS